ncbi:type II and III secretion system protein family protein [Acidithiobacillus sp. IBUN Pt1247-S3]|uniref:type II and III secretion system protein family protein n=1 Tax=Acidithiobacillus sp. IBUN Pt1247-S3 TaxID=3166642 RepID=UPI0034E53146
MRARFFALAIFCSFSSMAMAAEDEPGISLYAGQVKVIPSKAVKRVAVGNGKVLSTTVVDNRELLLLAEGAGETSLRVWYKDGGEAAYRVLVAPQDVGRAAEEIRTLVSGNVVNPVSVQVVGDHIVIDGKNLSQQQIDRINSLSLLYPKKTIVIANKEPFKMEKMVWLDVNVLEVRKTLLENFGVDWQKQISGPFVGYGKDFIGPRSVPVQPLGSDLAQPAVAGSGMRLTPAPVGLDGAIDLVNLARPISGVMNFGIITGMLSKINFALSNGDAWQIANPQLSARSGGTTNFLAGGQVPILQALATGAAAFQTVTFKDYGIQLNFSPQVDDSNNISMKVKAEVSEIDPATSVILNGLTVPGFLVRKSDAEINVQDGQTMVISGLVNPKTAKNVSKLPWLADVPILGNLFKSTNFQSGNTDLVILVTPRVVNPGGLENVREVSAAVRLKDEYRQTLGKDSPTREAIERTLGGKGVYPPTGTPPVQTPKLTPSPTTMPKS